MSCINEVQDNPTYCNFCFNARVYQPTIEEQLDPFDNELTDDNDASSYGIGKCYGNEHSIMLNSGGGRPLNVEFRVWFDYSQCWITVGRYYPKYCPECGRKIDEYDLSQYRND